MDHVLDKKIDIKDNFPYPYAPEKFTAKEKKILSNFFSNCDKPVFAIFNLPQEVIGAMFSRYSRTAKSIRRVFLDEFWGAQDLGIVEKENKSLAQAKERTLDFYKRVFAEFGDDSVIQMGSVHIAFEYVSQIAAKAIEDRRVGAAYIEKSTRYVNFGEKANGRFLFMDPPEIISSKFKHQYLEWNNLAFSSYIKSLEICRKFLLKKFPIESQVFTSPKTGKTFKFEKIKDSNEKQKAQRAYDRALRAKTFDTIRYFLPITSVTNLGAHFSGQAAEYSINNMLSSCFEEVRTLGNLAYQELEKVVPSFLQNINHQYGQVARDYLGKNISKCCCISEKYLEGFKKGGKDGVKLVDWDKDALVKIAAQILYKGQGYKNVSKERISQYISKLSKSKLNNIVKESVEHRLGGGVNRRHKLPRAFEHAYAEVEFYQDYGVYKDLQRNRMSTFQRAKLTADDVKIPPEYRQKGMMKVYDSYMRLFEKTKSLRRQLLNSGDENLANAAEYITIHGNKVRFNIRANLRQWVFFAELRTIAGGHPAYRNALQDAARQIIEKWPFSKELFACVDWKKDYGLGRLSAEIWTQDKLAEINKDTRN